MRIGSDLLIEKNQFAVLSKAVFGSDGGKATLADNVAIGNSSKKTTLQDLPKGSFVPPYEYAADAAGDVISLTTTYAGVGKINTSEYETGSTSLGGPSASPGRPAAWRVGGRIAIRSAPGLAVRVTDLAGRSLYTGTTSATEALLPLSLKTGVYLVRSGAEEGRLLAP